jgi:flagellar protein FlgJ
MEIRAVSAGLRNEEDTQLKKACQEFEAMFYRLLLKEMRKTIPEGGLINRGLSMEIYETWLDERLADEFALRGDLGIGRALYAQLSGLLR